MMEKLKENAQLKVEKQNSGKLKTSGTPRQRKSARVISVPRNQWLISNYVAKVSGHNKEEFSSTSASG